MSDDLVKAVQDIGKELALFRNATAKISEHIECLVNGPPQPLSEEDPATLGRARQDGNLLVLTVDNGKGLEPRNVEVVFEGTEETKTPAQTVAAKSKVELKFAFPKLWADVPPDDRKARFVTVNILKDKVTTRREVLPAKAGDKDPDDEEE